MDEKKVNSNLKMEIGGRGEKVEGHVKEGE